MDSLTHIVLGAIIGEAMAGRRLGKKAMLLGAVAQSIPDIDFIASSWLDTSRDVLAHRGITHSFLFVALMGTALGLLARRLERRGRADRGGSGGGSDVERDADVDGSEGGSDTDRGVEQTDAERDAGAEGSGRGSGTLTLRGWLSFFWLQLFVHIFLDAFNAYGTGWFEPFSHYRVSFHILFVADPFYSVWLGIAFLALLILKRNDLRRKSWAAFGLILSSCYLCYCLTNKIRIDVRVKKELERQ